MAAKTYKTRAIVLRKTKLAEKDLVVTLLAEDGSLIRAVAKGARRPGGSLAAKLELFNVADLMLARGRNLDVVTDARFADGEVISQLDVEQAACAAVLAELLACTAQENLPHDRLFDMARIAFSNIGNDDARTSLAISVAALLKAHAMCGLRPQFGSCVLCGNDLPDGPAVPFSAAEGGFICASCPRPADAEYQSPGLLRWAHALMMSTFYDIAGFDIGVEELFGVLQIARQWTRVHIGRDLKSIDFLLTCALFAK